MDNYLLAATSDVVSTVLFVPPLDLLYRFLLQQAVGHAVTQCQPRSVIAQSGILPVLASMMPPQSTISMTSPGPALAQAHVEFLQACIYAGQYSYAEQAVADSWPRPTSTISVRNILRYFYLRGVVHVGCQNYKLAVRCFRTCLCIPSEVVSAIAVAAWKKLVLVECLLQADCTVAETLPTALPKPTPVCLSRYINHALTSKTADGRGGSSKAAPMGAAAAAPYPNEDASAAIVHMVGRLETGEGSRGITDASRLPFLGCAVYGKLTQAFVNMDKEGLAQVLAEQQRLFTWDGNLGLARQVETELPRRQIYSWSRVYSSIGLSDLAGLLGLSVDDLRPLLLQVTIAKEWPIHISEEGQMVTFPKMEPILDDHASQDLLALAKLVQKLDATLSASSKFMSMARKAEATTQDGKAGGGPRGVEDV